ncbi:hypothetical protein HJFPF1_06311 [Paramyrothecium foliicola]|nr:hypothetical protein HJFPF1_06311 [Paramyrothecium foliicola]
MPSADAAGDTLPAYESLRPTLLEALPRFVAHYDDGFADLLESRTRQLDDGSDGF